MLSNPSSAERAAAPGGDVNKTTISGSGVIKTDSVVSPVIVRENIRRFWPMGFVALLVYFAMGPVPMLLSRPGSVGTEVVVVSSGVFDFLMYLPVVAVFAVISAVAVFRYLHSPSALSVVHALPVARRTLFLSNFLSGLLLLLAPFAVNAALIFMLKDDSRVGTGALLLWFVLLCAAMVFMYAVSVLAGMVSGSTPVHLFVAAAFNFAWLLIYEFAVIQAAGFLYGMPNDSTIINAGMYLHPALYFAGVLGSLDSNTVMINGFEPLPPAVGLPLYLLIAIAVSVASYFLFHRFKAERAGRPITAGPVEYVFVYLVTAAGMLIGALLVGKTDPQSGYAVQMADSGVTDPVNYVNPYYLIGAVIGAVVSFLVATMILKKSARVFTVAALRRFGLFAAAAAVFMVCTMTNVTGYETRVPAPSEVAAGAFHTGAYMLPPYRYGMYDYGSNFVPVRDEEGIDALTALHSKAVTDSAALYKSMAATPDGEEANDGSVMMTRPMDFFYALKRGGQETRTYAFSDKYLRESNEFARLLSSTSVKDYLSIESLLGYDALKAPEVYYADEDGNGGSVNLDTDVRNKLAGAALQELATLLDEDYRAMSANDMMHPGKELFTLSLSSKRAGGVAYFSGRKAVSGEGESLYQWYKMYGDAYRLRYTVTEKNVKAIAWLKEFGVYDSIVRTADELKRDYGGERDYE